MAGTLTISTLSDGTNSTSSTNCIQGSAKAWVNFNGTTSPGTIRTQYNVSSVTKNGTGDYTVNFTNAFSDANYSISGLAGYTQGTQGNSSMNQLGLREGYYPTASSARLQVLYSNGAVIDSGYVCISCFR